MQRGKIFWWKRFKNLCVFWGIKWNFKRENPILFLWENRELKKQKNKNKNKNKKKNLPTYIYLFHKLPLWASTNSNKCQMPNISWDSRTRQAGTVMGDFWWGKSFDKSIHTTDLTCFSTPNITHLMSSQLPAHIIKLSMIEFYCGKFKLTILSQNLKSYLINHWSITRLVCTHLKASFKLDRNMAMKIWIMKFVKKVFKNLTYCLQLTSTWRGLRYRESNLEHLSHGSGIMIL